MCTTCVTIPCICTLRVLEKKIERIRRRSQMEEEEHNLNLEELILEKEGKKEGKL